MANTYDVGDVVRCTGTFTDADGTAQNPTAVSFAVRAPSATAATVYAYGTDAEVVRSATGVYYVDVSITGAGTWWYRFYATGTGKSAGEQHFSVREQMTV